MNNSFDYRKEAKNALVEALIILTSLMTLACIITACTSSCSETELNPVEAVNEK